MDGPPLISSGGQIAEISADCRWRRAGIDCALLGGLFDRGAAGGPVPIRDADREHDGLRHHRLLHELSGPARGVESSVAIPGPGWVHRRVQHVFDVRVGDAVDIARRSFRDCGSLCGWKSCAGTCGGLGRIGTGGDGAVTARSATSFWERFERIR